MSARRLRRADCAGALADVLAQVHADARAPVFVCDPDRLARTLSTVLAIWRAGARPTRADGELERVHRVELARLLCDASRLVASTEPLAELYALVPAPVPGFEDWTCRAVEELELLRLDALSVAPAWALRECLRRDPARWPSAVALAEEALAASDGDEARLQLGAACVAEGDSARATSIYRDVARAALARARVGEDGDVRWRALEGLAAAHLQRGAERLALGACAAATADPRCGAGVHVEHLFLALSTGDVGRARRAAARLDLRVDPSDPSLPLALRRLRVRVELASGLPWVAPLATAGPLRDLAEGEVGPARAVCCALRAPAAADVLDPS